MKSHIAVEVAIAGALVFGCTDLPDVGENVCGNLVLDRDEDCDQFSQFGDGTACGEPGGDNECRYICDAAEGLVCPAGWGCGDDGQCRRPAGRYEPAADSPWRFRVKDFVIGDVDGDGHEDLVGNEPAAISMRFGDGSGAFPIDHDLLIRPTTGPLSFGYFDDGALLDVVVPNVGGLFVLLGQAAQTLEPMVYSPFEIQQEGQVLLVAVESSLVNFSTEVLIIADDPDADTGFMKFMESSEPGVGLPGGHHPVDIAGEVPVADVNSDLGQRQEWAIALRHTSSVWVYTSTGSAGADGNTLRPALFQEVPIPGQVLEGARFADVDGNGWLDLMVSIEDNAHEHKVAVAYATGLGLFGAATIEEVFDRGAASPWPIQAGDLAGSVKADYVYPEAVYIADVGEPAFVGPPAGLKPTVFTAGLPWHEAVFGDFNGDGLRDVATAAEGSDGMEFLINGGIVFFNRFFRDTEEPPARLSVGDYDGDRVADVAFAEIGFGSKPDGLSVIFGSTSGGPTDPVEMGQMDIIESMAAVSSVRSFESIDLITDLIVVSESFEEPGTRWVAIMEGSSSRRMISPFALQPEEGVSPDIPHQVMLCGFDDDSIRDIAAVAEVAIDVDVTSTEEENLKRPFHLWVVPGAIGDGSLDSPNADFTELPEYTEFDSGCSTWTAGDLDGIGRDELVAIDNSIDCYGYGFSPAPRLLVASATPGADDPYAVSVVDLPGDFRCVRDLALHDLDADGDLDLLALFMGEARGTEISDMFEGAAVVVLWNDGGSLSLANPTELAVSQARYLFDVEPFFQNDDGVPELAILTDKGALLARLEPTTLAYQVEPGMLGGAVGEGRLEVGDLDGDGLDDLAITAESDVFVFLGQRADLLGLE